MYFYVRLSMPWRRVVESKKTSIVSTIYYISLLNEFLNILECDYVRSYYT